MESRVCSKCKVDTPLDNYHKAKNGKCGLMSWCKCCDKSRTQLSSKQRYLKHKNEKSEVYYNLRANHLKQRADGSITGKQLMVLMETCGNKCSYCHATADLEFDHKISVDGGGQSDLDNIQILCKNCNRMKGKMSHFEYIKLLLHIIHNTQNTQS